MRVNLREARWFGRERAQGYARVLAIAFAPTFVWFYLQAIGPTGSDFLVFWSSAKLALSGVPAAAYDAAAQIRVQSEILWTRGSEFLNPPPFLLLILPVGLLPYHLAWPAWVGATYCIWLLVARRLIPDATWPVAVFPGAMLAAWHAQNGLVTAALFLGAMLSLRSARPALAGALLGALIIKPHLALLVPVALVAGREWKAFAAAAVSAASLLVLSWLIFGTATFAGFLHTASFSTYIFRASHEASGIDFYLRMPTIFAALRPIAGGAIAIAAQSLAAIVMTLLVFRVWSRSDDALGKGSVLAVATALSVPYLFHYDLAVLILPICWLVREAMRSAFLPWEKAMIALFYWAPLAARAVAPALNFNPMPLVLIALLWAILRRMNLASRSGDGDHRIRRHNVFSKIR